MANDRIEGQSSKDDGWVELGGTKAAPRPEVVGAPAVDEDNKPFEGKAPTPPWKYSVYTGMAGLVLMTLAYILPDFRRIETPWDRSFPLAIAMLAFPILSLVWGFVGVFGRQYRKDIIRSVAGIVLALLTFAMAYADIVADEDRMETTQVPVDPRLQMTPQELQEWRTKKLQR